MAQKSKKKTVKDLSEDLVLLENKYDQSEKLIKLLNDKVVKLEKQLK